MRDGGGVALTSLFTSLLISGLALLILVGLRVLLGGIGPPAPTSGGPRTTVTQPGPTSSEARRILDERYTSGELTTQEYREHVDNLGEEP